MKDQLRGQPIHKVEIIEDQTATHTADGRPIVAAQEYTFDEAPADGRPIISVSDDLDDGSIATPIALFDTGALKTDDGRPIHAMMGFDAAGASDPVGATTPGFDFNFVTSTYTVEGNPVLLSAITYTRSGALALANAAGTSITNFAANTIPVTDEGLHCYGALSNLCPNPSAFNNWLTYNGMVVTANQANGMTGALEADQLAFAAAADSQVYQTFAEQGAGYYNYELWGWTTSGTKGFRLQLWPGGASYSSDKTATTTQQRHQHSIYLGGNSRYAVVNLGAGDAGNILAWGAQAFKEIEFPTVRWPIVASSIGAPSMSFALTDGAYALTYTFDDNSTQEVSVTASSSTLTLTGSWPQGLARPVVKSIVGVPETNTLRLVGRCLQAVAASGDTTVNFSDLNGGIGGALQQNDIALVFIGGAWVAGGGPAMVSAGYTASVNNLQGNDNDDSVLDFHYKIMGGTPDTTVVVNKGGEAGTVYVEVWRGVNTTTPLDVAVVTSTGIDGNKPNFGSITPITAGAVLVGATVQAVDGAIPAFTSTDFQLFQRCVFGTTTGNDNHRMAGCSKRWTSGAFDAAAFGGGSAGLSAAYSAIIVALRPSNPDPLLDPYLSHVVLLVGADTAVVDESGSGHSIALTGTATRGTDNGKFGAGYLNFPTTGGGVSGADHVDYHLGGGDFTIEMFYRPDSGAAAATSNADLLQQWGASGNRGWSFGWNVNVANNPLVFDLTTGGATVITPLTYNWSPIEGADYYHLCVERFGNTFRMYIDGVMVASASNSSVIFDSTANLQIGAAARGRIDEVRLTKGVARYASDAGFAVPTAAYPR